MQGPQDAGPRDAAAFRDGLAALLPTGAAWPRDNESALMRVVAGLARVWARVDARAADLLREADPRQTVELLDAWEGAFGLPDPCVAEPLTRADRLRALLQRMTQEGTQALGFFQALARELGYDVTIREFSPFQCGISQCGEWLSPRDLWYAPDGALLTTEDGRVLVDASFDYAEAYPTASLVIDGEAGLFGARESAWLVHPDASLAIDGDARLFAARPVASIGEPLRVRALDTGPLVRVPPRWEIGPATMRFYWLVRVRNTRLTWFQAGIGQCGVDPMVRIAGATDLECILAILGPAHMQLIFDYSPE
ncbi:putative phage tail protein [Salinarimonas sp.]|uniref:putative phage tail protein n=1 Tax=Salinarimonas sp. TaxID=2766526 RepID=UPI003919777D